MDLLHTQDLDRTSTLRFDSALPDFELATEQPPIQSHVRFFTEEELTVWRPDEPPRGTVNLLVELLSCTSAAERKMLVRHLLFDMGFDSMVYATARALNARSTARTCLVSYTDEDWARRYFEERFFEVDPRREWVTRSGMPMIWEADDLRRAAHAEQDAERKRAFIEMSLESGVSSGVFIALPGAQHGTRAVISLTSSVPGRRWMSDAVTGRALVLALGIHQFISDYTSMSRTLLGMGRSISQTQTRVLECLARGMRDKEIASQLDIPVHNVDYHLRRLRGVFGVRNRVQLIEAALEQLAF